MCLFNGVEVRKAKEVDLEHPNPLHDTHVVLRDREVAVFIPGNGHVVGDIARS